MLGDSIKKRKKTAEEKEYDKVCDMIDKKEAGKLGEWLGKFAEKGEFWIGESDKEANRDKD